MRDALLLVPKENFNTFHQQPRMGGRKNARNYAGDSHRPTDKLRDAALSDGLQKATVALDIDVAELHRTRLNSDFLCAYGRCRRRKIHSVGGAEFRWLTDRHDAYSSAVRRATSLPGDDLPAHRINSDDCPVGRDHR